MRRINRVSEGLTPLDFSHHRTYGSRITAVLKLTNSEHIEFIEHTYKTLIIKVYLPECIVHMRCT